MRLLIAIAAGVAGYCYYRGVEARTLRQRPEEITRWEGEGGNVPAVATPTPKALQPSGNSEAVH